MKIWIGSAGSTGSTGIQKNLQTAPLSLPHSSTHSPKWSRRIGAVRKGRVCRKGTVGEFVGGSLRISRKCRVCSGFGNSFRKKQEMIGISDCIDLPGGEGLFGIIENGCEFLWNFLKDHQGLFLEVVRIIFDRLGDFPWRPIQGFYRTLGLTRDSPQHSRGISNGHRFYPDVSIQTFLPRCFIYLNGISYEIL